MGNVKGENMRKDLQLAIENEFSFMKRRNVYEVQKRNGRISDLYGAFGCEFGDGWFIVIEGLCKDITRAYEEEEKEIDIIPLQIKQKFGALRFYYKFVYDNPGICALDFIGPDALMTARFTPNETELRRKIADIVRKWEEKSVTICEDCGKDGYIRKDMPWVATLCDNCYEIRIVGRSKEKARKLYEEFKAEQNYK